MNYNEHPDDSALARELRESLFEVAAPERPPLAAISNRGRAYQRRQLAGFAGLGVAGVAAGSALVLGLTGVLGAAPARSAGTIRTAAFTLTSNANGTDTLTLTDSQILDPAALQQALAQHGIPALVKTDAFCYSRPAPPLAAVLSHHHGPLADGSVTVINPAAMPSGTELFFYVFYGPAAGQSNSEHQFAVNLIYTNSYACSVGQIDPNQPVPSPSPR